MLAGVIAQRPLPSYWYNLNLIWWTDISSGMKIVFLLTSTIVALKLFSELCKKTLSMYRHIIYLLLFTFHNTLFKRNLWYSLLSQVTILVSYLRLYFTHIFLVSRTVPFQLPFTSPSPARSNNRPLITGMDFRAAGGWGGYCLLELPTTLFLLYPYKGVPCSKH